MSATGGPYGAEHAVVLPDNSQTMQMAANLLAVSEQRKKYEVQRQKEEEDRQGQLMMYLGKEFDEKNFATGTPTDRVINDSLRTMKESYSQMIMKNPNLRLADLGYMIQGDVGKLNRYSVAAKTVRSNIDEVTKGLEADKSVDAKAVKMGALNKAFFKMNTETNQYELKDPDEIDLNTDYVSEFMDEKPELWAKGRTGIDMWLGKQKPVKVGDSRSIESGGVTNVYDWEADQMPFQNITKDKMGRPSGLSVKTQSVPMPDGSKMEVLDESSYQDMISEYRGVQGYIDSQIKKNPALKNLDKNGDEWQIARRRFAMEILSDAPQNAAFRTKTARGESNWREKWAYGAGVAAGGGGTKREQDKALKSNPIEALIRAKAGDNDFLNGTMLSNGMIDITSRIPGATLYSGKIKKQDGKAQPESYEKVMYNPNDSNFYVADENYNMDNPMKIENFDRWINDIAEANGVALKSVPSIKKNYQDETGEIKWVNPTSKAAIRNLRVRQHNTDLEDELANFRMNPKENVVSLVKSQEVAGVTDIQYKDGGFFSEPKITFRERGKDGKKKEASIAEFEQLIRSKMIK